MTAWREIHVVVVASGLTEREALPHLLRESTARTGRRVAVVFPPNNQHLSPEIAARLIKAQYWGLYPRPEKVVVLVDTDASERQEIENQMRTALEPLVADLGGVPLDVENREALFRSRGRVLTVARV